MTEKRRFTAAEREAIAAFLSQRLGQFERGVVTSREMVAIADLPMHRNQLQYYLNCVGCVKTLLSNLASAPVLLEETGNGN